MGFVCQSSGLWSLIGILRLIYSEHSLTIFQFRLIVYPALRRLHRVSRVQTGVLASASRSSYFSE